MPEQSYVGKKETYTLHFKVSGVFTDPTGITVTVRDPSGNNSALSETKVSTGVYTVSHTPDESGRWQLHIATTGDVETVGYLDWTVLETVFD